MISRHRHTTIESKTAPKPRKRAVVKTRANSRYSFENALKFWKSHRVDLSTFEFDRAEANESHLWAMIVMD
ncbi:MAG: hypothetical protein Q8922_15280 [Bacteroidota bacterium]|nr:hypothetical protein [Bacteroidota bacterium]MDP4232619.1 hypothetical protein [Bacteroidota bacterium]MDP4243871.1 hypothetical protein [Bacteroidota bacterium]MDP4289279.1 hypothetical protein [Bacteroidota bacterium]